MKPKIITILRKNSAVETMYFSKSFKTRVFNIIGALFWHPVARRGGLLPSPPRPAAVAVPFILMTCPRVALRPRCLFTARSHSHGLHPSYTPHTHTCTHAHRHSGPGPTFHTSEKALMLLYTMNIWWCRVIFWWELLLCSLIMHRVLWLLWITAYFCYYKKANWNILKETGVI